MLLRDTNEVRLFSLISVFGDAIIDTEVEYSMQHGERFLIFRSSWLVITLKLFLFLQVQKHPNGMRNLVRGAYSRTIMLDLALVLLS